ncbi:unnamed protein product, partial [marine sediment metagenome]
GCGRNTILTTTTADLDIITATGAADSEKVGILIADLCIDGTAGGSTVSLAINFTYVDYSKVRDIWVLNCTTWGGVGLITCDFNKIIGNTFKNSGETFYIETSCFNIIADNSISGGDYEGIFLTELSNSNTISDNICQGNSSHGIYLAGSNSNTISGNICQGNGNYGIYVSAGNNVVSGNICQRNNDHGIFVSGNNNIVSDNVCQWNGDHGIYVSGDNNVVSGNNCQGNSQAADNTYDNIGISSHPLDYVTSNEV